MCGCYDPRAAVGPTASAPGSKRSARRLRARERASESNDSQTVRVVRLCVGASGTAWRAPHRHRACVRSARYGTVGLMRSVHVSGAHMDDLENHIRPLVVLYGLIVEGCPSKVLGARYDGKVTELVARVDRAVLDTRVHAALDSHRHRLVCLVIVDEDASLQRRGAAVRV